MNGGQVTIVYDGDGNRVTKNVSGTATSYLVDDLNPTGYPQVVEELTSGVESRTYTYGLQRISEYQVIQGAWTPSFYGYDGGGNVRQLTNSAGTVSDTYEYDAFGNSFTVSGSTPNEMMYRGEQYDSDLGLYYLRARYMNPLTGRFMSRDPEAGKLADPRSLHKYLYAGGDPINRIDPTGRADLFEFDLRLQRVLRAAPTWKEWTDDLVTCGLAIAAQIQSDIAGDSEGVQEDSLAEVSVNCAIFFFDSFKLIYSMTP